MVKDYSFFTGKAYSGYKDYLVMEFTLRDNIRQIFDVDYSRNEFWQNYDTPFGKVAFLLIDSNTGNPVMIDYYFHQNYKNYETFFGWKWKWIKGKFGVEPVSYIVSMEGDYQEDIDSALCYYYGTKWLLARPKERKEGIAISFEWFGFCE